MDKRPKRHDREPGDDTITRLIEAAGSRPADDEVMAHDLATMRQRVEQRWRERARGDQPRPPIVTSRRFALAIAAAVLASIATGWLAIRFLSDTGPPTVGVVLASVESVRGQVTASDLDGTLIAGVDLRAENRIETGTGRVALRLESGESLRLDRDTAAVLVAASRVRLERGCVYVDAGTNRRGSGLVIETPFGEALDIGTQFTVTVGDDRLTVRVREGMVELRQGGSIVAVEAGEEVRTNRDGEIDRRALDASGVEWEWILAVAPPYELAGATAAEYLGWLQRETGWRVRYGSDSAREIAGDAVLQGSIAGIDPRQTPEVALLSAGLDYRLEGSVLIVDLAASDP